jgi:hypothetical protein
MTTAAKVEGVPQDLPQFTQEQLKFHVGKRVEFRLWNHPFKKVQGTVTACRAVQRMTFQKPYIYTIKGDDGVVYERWSRSLSYGGMKVTTVEDAWPIEGDAHTKRGES